MSVQAKDAINETTKAINDAVANIIVDNTIGCVSSNIASISSAPCPVPVYADHSPVTVKQSATVKCTMNSDTITTVIVSQMAEITSAITASIQQQGKNEGSWFSGFQATSGDASILANVSQSIAQAISTSVSNQCHTMGQSDNQASIQICGTWINSPYTIDQNADSVVTAHCMAQIGINVMQHDKAYSDITVKTEQKFLNESGLTAIIEYIVIGLVAIAIIGIIIKLFMIGSKSAKSKNSDSPTASRTTAPAVDVTASSGTLI